MSTEAEIELAFYERFFFEKDLEPYPVQEEAFGHIFKGESVLVTVPTGTGKTMIAKAGIFRALSLGQTAVYTTPLRALTEEKFRELCEDFGEDKVGFATGDYQVNPGAPIQVVVAEILWNRIFTDRVQQPADIVIMDEGHYFNDPERGYVWEQSVIGLDPRSQLVILSATVGNPEQFCEWAYSVRRIPLTLVRSEQRQVPLYHEFQEEYLVDLVRKLFGSGDYPAIIFVFGRDQCFEHARLLKSCPRFTTKEEQARIEELAHPVLLDRGIAAELRPLLLHGIGVHHAGLLPRYKRLVEELTLERLVKFVVSTETISAGINLPAKRVVFPSLRKFIKSKARLLTSAEYHQMAGRAGRPQFDTEGIAITLAPQEVVQEVRKEIRDAKKAGYKVDEAKIRKSAYSRAMATAMRTQTLLWNEEAHRQLVDGKPAALSSHTRVTADQILTIGLPDLQAEPPSEEEMSGGARLPVSLRLDIKTVLDNLFIEDRAKRDTHRQLEQLVENLQALEILDEHGQQVRGEMIRDLRGVDGPFVFHCLVEHELPPEQLREMTEYLVDHDTIARILRRKDEQKRRDWIATRLRERRREEPQVSWEDVEAEFEEKFPRELSEIEKIHQTFAARVPHPELHGGKVHKTIWATIDEEGLSLMDFVELHSLEREEGSLFSYLARVMKVARTIHEATGVPEFDALQNRIREKLGAVDDRVLREG